MIAYIKGTLDTVGEDRIVIDFNNMGYEVKIPLSIISQLPPIGDEVKVYTYLYVREDAMLLYGFLTNDDLNVFKLLLTVNGIGPKGALAILSALTPDALRFAVVTGDDIAISKAPGIGKKTAQRLIIDLKDKLKLKDYGDTISKEAQAYSSSFDSNDSLHEAIAALISLGYSNTEAVKATKGLSGADQVEDILKHALKQLARL
ncbi:MAG: Holliday junction branch migration protein RuvA [Firmicutes bacterium HGW-Firmicutes-1]|jgi:Holliday junction DNA helicase RuvA|nr:MAG: Holliday junction branch migration protein RuvA [Firmicutes bacterium HGW-Firmicutes-1]